MVFFPNEKIEIYEYTETGELNSYQEPKKEYQLTCTIPCDFQTMSPNDTLKEFGEILEDTYKIYLPKEVNISPSMIIRLVGKPDTYEILGTPIMNNHLLPVQHIKLVVKKQRKPTKVNTE